MQTPAPFPGGASWPGPLPPQSPPGLLPPGVAAAAGPGAPREKEPGRHPRPCRRALSQSSARAFAGIFFWFGLLSRLFFFYSPLLLLSFFLPPPARAPVGSRAHSIPFALIQKGNVPFPFEITDRHSGALRYLRGFILFYSAGTKKWKRIFLNLFLESRGAFSFFFFFSSWQAGFIPRN